MSKIEKRSLKAFTLIELLIVIIIISLIYAIVFNNFLKKEGKIDSLNIKNIKEYMNSTLKDAKGISSLVCSTKMKRCYLLNNGKVLDKQDFNFEFESYYLQGAEIFFPSEFNYVDIDDENFKPSFIVNRYENRTFSPTILKSDDKWYYLTSYFGNVELFSNEQELINFMQKRDFLPMYVGHADE